MIFRLNQWYNPLVSGIYTHRKLRQGGYKKLFRQSFTQSKVET